MQRLPSFLYPVPMQTYLSLREELSERGDAPTAGLALCRRLTAALDAELAALLDSSKANNGGLALVAVGGYGRGELCLRSDVDLMLLHGGRLPAGETERILYPLWDANLKVGHAVRTVREAIQAAEEEFQTLTALLDARLVAGDPALFASLVAALGRHLRQGRVDLRGPLASLEAERRAREPYPLQELHLKDGRGGLRALQGLHWEHRGAELRDSETRPPQDDHPGSNLQSAPTPRGAAPGTPRAYEAASVAPLSVAATRRVAAERPNVTEQSPGAAPALQGAGGRERDTGAGGVTPALSAAHDTLLATRNALHAVSGRPYDQYVHDLQQRAAEWLGVDERDWGQRLYQAAHQVDRTAGEHWATGSSPPPPAAEPRASGRRWPRLGRRGAAGADSPPALRAAASSVALPPGAAARETDVRMATPQEGRGELAEPGGSILALAAGAIPRPSGPPPFTPAETALIRAAPGPTWSGADREGLLALLRAGDRGRELFDALDALGWAERALPEWAHVRGLPQYAPFHLHPCDVHLWRTVAELLAIVRPDGPEPELAAVAAELDSLDDALLAALLHDIGKGWPGDHSLVGARAVRAICLRVSFPPRSTATVSRAIQHHLLLPTVATRRDLDDPRVVAGVADAAGDRRTLRILYLLSVADSRATGPAVWSAWKATLMRTLYERVDEELARRVGAIAAAPAAFDLGSLVAALADAAPESVVRQHVEAMPAGYIQSWSTDELAAHIRLMWPPPVGDEARLAVANGAGADDLTLAVADRPGLLALTSGVLALHTISVLGGRFATRADGVALQALHVVDALGQSIEPARWERVRRDLSAALRGALPLEQRLAEKRHAYRRAAGRPLAPSVRVDPDASTHATLVEVHAADRIGLLHAVTRALYEENLDIHLAKVDTLGREVVDVFYVRDLSGEPPRAPEQIAAIKARVLAALAG